MRKLLSRTIRSGDTAFTCQMGHSMQVVEPNVPKLASQNKAVFAQTSFHLAGVVGLDSRDYSAMAIEQF